MADENMWDRIRKELATPWDWVAAGVGAATGLGVSVAVGGVEAGTSAGIGALAAVSARKAGAAAFRGTGLAKRARGLLHILIQEPIPSSYATSKINNEQIIREVKRDLNLWEQRVISDDQFDALLNQHTENYRKLPYLPTLPSTDFLRP
jgi:hypothetical protein